MQWCDTPTKSLICPAQTPAGSSQQCHLQASPLAPPDLTAQQHPEPQPQQLPLPSAAGLPLVTPRGPATIQPLHSLAQQALPQAARSAQASDATAQEAATIPSAQPARPAFLPGKARLNSQTTAVPQPPAQHPDRPPGDRRSLDCCASPQQLHRPSHGALPDASAAALSGNESRLMVANVAPTAAPRPAAAVALSGRGHVAQGVQHMHLEQPRPVMAFGTLADGTGSLPAAVHWTPSPFLPADNPANQVRQKAGAAHRLPGPQAQSAVAQHDLLSAAALKETARADPYLKLEPTGPQPHMPGAPLRPTTQPRPAGPQHHMLPAAATAKALEAAAAALTPQPAVAAAAPVARDCSPEGWGAALVQCSLSGLRYHLGCLPAPAQEVGCFLSSTRFHQHPSGTQDATLVSQHAFCDRSACAAAASACCRGMRAIDAWLRWPLQTHSNLLRLVLKQHVRPLPGTRL